MAGVGQFNGQFRRYLVAHLAHHNDVGVVAEDGAKGLLEFELVGELDLTDSRNDVLNRILNGQHIHFRRASEKQADADDAADGDCPLLKGAEPVFARARRRREETR